MLHDTCVQMVSGCQQSDDHPKVHSIDILTAAKSYVDDTNWVYSGATDPYQEKTKKLRDSACAVAERHSIAEPQEVSINETLLSKMYY